MPDSNKNNKAVAAATNGHEKVLNGEEQSPAASRAKRNKSGERAKSPERMNTGNTNGRSRSRSRTRSRGRRDTESAMNDAVPLLPSEKHLPRPIPPLAGPEIDDETTDTNHTPFPPTAQPGVDDGFFINTNDHPPKKHPDADHDEDEHIEPRANFPPFPLPPGFELDMGNPENPRIIPDVNVYQHKKTLAQGMMDLALLSANANQLRYVLAQQNHPYYYFNLVFIASSLIIQVLVGIGLILNSRYNVKNEDDICKADRINNLTVLGIFLITVVNVFISAFGVADAPARRE